MLNKQHWALERLVMDVTKHKTGKGVEGTYENKLHEIFFFPIKSHCYE